MKPFFLFVTLFAISGLTSCSRYSFDVNSNEIYRPPSLYTSFSVPDQALQSCLDQAIKDAGVTESQQLKNLNCSFAGVEDLTGISQFCRLQQLSLKGNKLTNIDEVVQLTHLRFLDISDNPMSECESIKQLLNIGIENFIHTSSCNIQ